VLNLKVNKWRFGFMEDYKESNYNVWAEKNGKLYLLNTFSSSVLEIDISEKELVEDILSGKTINMECNSKLSRYHKILVDNNFLVNCEIDESKQLEYTYKELYFGNNSLNITLLPTMKCNFSCEYCFEEDHSTSWNEENIDILKNYAEKSFKNKEKVHIALFGGEPLLEWSKLKVLYNHIEKIKSIYKFNFTQSIATNAYLMNENIINEMVDMYSFIAFQITIDGFKESHNKTRKLRNGGETYGKVLENLKLLIRKKVNSKKNILINLRINLLNNDLTEIEQLLNEFDSVEKENILIYFRPVYKTKHFCKDNRNEANLEEFYNLANEKGFNIQSLSEKGRFQACEGDGGLSCYEITPDLDVWKCMNDMDCKYAKIGKIDESGTLVVNHNHLEKWSRNNPFNDDECKECKMLPLCWGGCPLYFLKYNQRVCFHEKGFDIVNLFLNSN
jgi:uncharacterized protein